MGASFETVAPRAPQDEAKGDHGAKKEHSPRGAAAGGVSKGVTDDNSFSGRVRRYAQVSTAMGGLAARLAGERYLGLSLDRGRHASELKAALGGIKGPLMKVAQLLATIPDALPKEYVQELVQLQTNAPAMGGPFVRRRMAGGAGAGWRGRVSEV